jgi:hypothetical protein
MTSNSDALKQSASPILTLSLKYGVILIVAIAVVGSIVGFLVAGGPGVASALIGAGLTAIFMAFTAVSILLAIKATSNDPTSVLFYGIVLGAWILKFIVFIVALLLLRGQPFINPIVMFAAILVAVIGSLVVDVLAFARARVPYVGNISLPQSPQDDS